jgi:hypothetical protein
MTILINGVTVGYVTWMQKENGDDRLAVHYEDKYEAAVLILKYYSSRRGLFGNVDWIKEAPQQSL